MKKILYYSAKLDLIEKKQDCEQAIGKFVKEIPSWYITNHKLLYPSFDVEVYIYNFNRLMHKGCNYDFIIEESPNLFKNNVANLFDFINPKTGVILTKDFIDETGTAGWETVVFQKSGSFTLSNAGSIIIKAINDHICNHSWKTYLGFNDSFEYCEKCDKRK